MNTVSANDIKFDLLKIIEPWDGRLEKGNPRPVKNKFMAYLSDLQAGNMVYDFNIDSTERDDAYTFDISVRLGAGRSPKKLKIHVGMFKAPWVKKA